MKEGKRSWGLSLFRAFARLVTAEEEKGWIELIKIIWLPADWSLIEASDYRNPQLLVLAQYLQIPHTQFIQHLCQGTWREAIPDISCNQIPYAVLMGIHPESGVDNRYIIHPPRWRRRRMRSVHLWRNAVLATEHILVVTNNNGRKADWRA